MNGRQAITDVFERKTPDRPVVCIRLEQWHKDALSRNTLPDEIAGLTLEEIQVRLGFAVAARFRGYATVEFECAECSRTEADGIITETIRGGGRELVSTSRLTPDMIAAGMGSHITKYVCESDDDYRALIAAWESARVTVNEDAFRAFDEATGDTGLPMAILGGCPAHEVPLRYTGYEQFYLDRVDRPDLQAKLIETMESVYREQLWPQVARGRAQLLLHGAHFSQSMTPPPFFEKHMAPYFADFNAAMHAAGKWTCFHSDADLCALIPRIPEIGFDCADCLATAPLVPETLADYVNAWQGKVIAWGALPSMIFPPTFPQRDYEEQVARVVDFARGRNDVILGSGDIVMPDTPWERLVYLAEAVAV